MKHSRATSPSLLFLVSRGRILPFFFFCSRSVFPSSFLSLPLPFYGIMLGPLRAALRGAGARAASSPAAAAARRGFAAGE